MAVVMRCGEKRGHHGPGSPAEFLWGGDQSVVRHPADYPLTPEDIRDVQEGRALHFKGEALELARIACEFFDPDEISWAWTVDQRNPYVVTGVILFEDQEVSSAHCHAPGHSVIRARREAEKSGCTIKGAGHTHGLHGGLFSSQTDCQRMVQLVEGRCGWGGSVFATATGRPRPADQASAGSDQPGAPRSFVVDLAPTPPQKLQLRMKTAGILPDDVEVELSCEVLRRDVSTFTTHNGSGVHVPVVTRESCSACGHAMDVRISTDTVIHIHAPEALTHERATRFLAECEKKAPSRRWRYQRCDYPSKQTRMIEIASDVACVGDDSSQPAEYVITRRGREWRVPAGVIENAAAACPALAEILWPDEAYSSDAAPAQSVKCAKGREE
jgi:hypothetical protein